MMRSIRFKILSGYFIISMLILVAGGLAIFDIHSLYKESHSASVIHAPYVDASMEIKLNATVAHLWFEEILSGAEKEERIKDVWSLIDEAVWYADALLEGGKNEEGQYVTLSDISQIEQTRKIKADLLNWRKAAVLRFQNRRNQALNDADLDAKFDASYDQLMEEADKLEGQFQNSMLKSNQSIYTAYITGIIILLITTITTFIISSFVGFLTGNRVSNSIKKVTNSLQEISEGDGDLTSRLETTSKDEFGAMAVQFNNFVTKIQSVIQATQKSNEELSATSDELAESSKNLSDNIQDQAAAYEQMTATTEEVNASMDTISENTENQSHNLQNLSEKMQELASLTNQIGTSNRESIKKMGTMLRSARQGEQLLSTMTESMQKIQSSSVKMNEIVQIINDISEKINLLALNAAIESARAGEAGRGFAVVADEISKLADQTASSIKGIDDLIKMNDKEINTGMQNVEQSNTTIGEIIHGIVAINEASDIFLDQLEQQLKSSTEVNHGMQELDAQTKSVTRSTHEQKEALNEISKSLSNVSNLTQTIAGSSEEMAASSSSLSQMAEDVKARIDYFKT